MSSRLYKRANIVTGIGIAACFLLGAMGNSAAEDSEALDRVFANPPILLSTTSTPIADEMLRRFETTYSSMDVDGFLELFGEDFHNIDVNRRVQIRGIEKWRSQTEKFMASHKCVGRKHLGRAVSGDSVVAEVEWWGIVHGEIFGENEKDRSYRYRGIVTLKIENNKIAQQLAYSDTGTLNEQLSAASPNSSC